MTKCLSWNHPFDNKGSTNNEIMSEIQLPEGWGWIKLREVCTLKNGYAFKSDDYIESGVPILRISNINQGIVDVKKAVRVKPEPEFDRFVVIDGDILLAMSGATTGKFGIYRSSEIAYQNQRVGNFIVTDLDRLSKPFLFYFLTNLKRKIEEDAYGGAQPNISSKKVEEYLIPLPPLPVQHQIVSRIEELFSELDAGAQELQTALKRLKIYRRAVLHYYMNNPDWERVKLGDVAEVSGGLTKNSKRDSLPLRMPYLRVANVYTNHLDLTEIKEIGVSPSEVKRTLLRKGDLLVVEGNGSIDQVGRVAIWNGSIESCLHQNHLIKIRFKELESANFVLRWMTSPEGRRRIESQASSTSGLHTLSISKIANIVFPLPDQNTQIQIVSEVEARLSETDSIETIIHQELVRAENLRQSILQQAFEGKLINQSDRGIPEKISTDSLQMIPSVGQLSLF